MTMADADHDLGIEVDAVESEAGAPIMPHLAVNGEDLNRLYPPLQAPQGEEHDDLGDDGGDCVYQYGLQIAEEIRAQSVAQGRRRRPSSTPTLCATPSST